LSLSSRITLVVLSATILISLVVTGLSVSAIDDFVKRQIREKFPAALNAAAERLELLHSQIRLDIETFARSPTVSGSLIGKKRDEEVNRYLSLVLDRFPQYKSLFLIDPAGKILVWAGEPYPQPEALAGRLAELQNHIGIVRSPDGPPHQVASAEVLDPRGRRIGSLNALMLLDAVEQQLRRDRSGDAGSIFLVDSTGDLLTSTPHRSAGEQFGSPLPGPGAASELTEYSTPRGVQMVGAGLRLKGLGASIHIEKPFRAAFEPIFVMVRRVLGFSLVTVAIFGLAAFGIATSILRPIRALLEGAQRVRDGDTQVVVAGGSKNDEFARLIRTFNDMTASLHQTRQQLQQRSAEAEAASVAKSQFLANMSHEIRTPLTAIVGYTDLMIEEGDLAKAPPSRVGYVEALRRNGQHLLTILNDILDLSKIEAGKIEVERILVSPQQIVEDVVGVMRQVAANKRIGFDVGYEGKVPAEVRTDPTRLRQILMNLVGNAVKFTDEGGVRLVIQLADSGSERPLLRFSVSDTGVGLSPEARTSIFRAFSQADASTTRRYGGTGLGLTISKRLAELLGGDLQVESIPNRGSTFSLTIDPGPRDQLRLIDPKAETVEEEEEKVDGPSTLKFLEKVREEGPHPKVLLVEDGPDNQRLISFTLKRCGFDVSIAENGLQGVEQALGARDSGEPYDVILMDMQMPVLDGYEATRKLREEDYDGPIIALTAHAMKGDREKCLAAGCDDFSIKPVDRRTLVEMILSYAQKRATEGADGGDPPREPCAREKHDGLRPGRGRGVRLGAAEKLEVIRLVEGSELSARRTLRELGVPRSTFYAWYRRYAEAGEGGLEVRGPARRRHWNRIPEEVRQQVVEMALEHTELSPRELACQMTDRKAYFLSESSVYRILKAYDHESR
jgi:signal transduction histidine kinase/CheY-like chemotaxis protein/transposase-like protein